MSYTPTTWQDGDIITAEKMNKLEQAVQNEQIGPAGPAGKNGENGKDGAAGKAGASVKAIKLTTDGEGKVTGGEATLTDESTVQITVTSASEAV